MKRLLMNPDNPLHTRLSVVQALKDPADESAWTTFAAVYGQAIFQWALVACHRKGIPNAYDTADEVRQDVLACIREKIKLYDVGRRDENKVGQFRAWLKRVTLNELHDHLRQRRRDHGVGGTAACDLLDAQPARAELGDRLDAALLRDLLHAVVLPRVRAEFHEHQWAAVTELGLEDGRAGGPDRPTPAEVAARHGYKASSLLRLKSDVLRRIREVSRELLPEVEE